MEIAEVTRAATWDTVGERGKQVPVSVRCRTEVETLATSFSPGHWAHHPEHASWTPSLLHQKNPEYLEARMHTEVAQGQWSAPQSLQFLLCSEQDYLICIPNVVCTHIRFWSIWAWPRNNFALLDCSNALHAELLQHMWCTSDFF